MQLAAIITLAVLSLALGLVVGLLARVGPYPRKVFGSRAVSTAPAHLHASAAPQSDSVEDRVAKRIEDSFQGIYLTLVSIIQGVAFGNLAQTVGANYARLDADSIGRSAVILALIVAVWQEYMIGATMYAWTPTVFDSLIPFLIGTGEFMMVGAIFDDVSSYLLFAMCTCIACLLAQINYFIQARGGGTTISRDAQQVLGSHPRNGWILAVLAVATTSALWAVSLYWTAPGASTVLVWLCTVPAAAAIVSVFLRWNLPVRYALHRK